jgi:uncharacterized protein (TIGR00730 family)
MSNDAMRGDSMQDKRRDSQRSRPPADSIPAPTHPQCREVPLPWEAPKSAADDPDAPRRIAAIMASPSYRAADQDADFMQQPEARGIRLQIDYLKAELLLESHGVEHTIVVFGSTRILESSAAQRRVDALAADLGAAPRDAALERRLAVARRILAKSSYYEVARELGRLVGNACQGPDDSRVTIMTGGGPGIMEAANRGVYEAGAKSIGLNITLPHEQFPNPYVTPGLCFSFHYFAIRKLHFLQRARALVVFPGGYGTLDELFETLALIQTQKMAPVPVILVGEQYWRSALNVQFLVDEGVIESEDRELFWYAESAEDIWHGILKWHQANGTPLFPAV